jgi:hypothetical protein
MNEILNGDLVEQLKIDIILFLYDHPGILWFDKNDNIINEQIGKSPEAQEAIEQLYKDYIIVHKNSFCINGNLDTANADVYLVKPILPYLWKLFLENKGIVHESV